MGDISLETLIEFEQRLTTDVLMPRDPESAMMTAESPWPAKPQRLPAMDERKATRCRNFAEERLSWIRNQLKFTPGLRAAVYPTSGARATSRGSATWWEAKIPYYGGFDIRMNETGTEIAYFGEDPAPLFNVDSSFRRSRQKFPMLRFDIRGYCTGIGPRFREMMHVHDARNALPTAVTAFAKGLQIHVEEIDFGQVGNVVAARLHRETRILSKFVADIDGGRPVSAPGWLVAEIYRPGREKRRTQRVEILVADDLGDVLSVTLGRKDLIVEAENGSFVISGPAEFLLDGRPENLWPRPEDRETIDMIREGYVSRIVRTGNEIRIDMGCHAIAIGDADAHFSITPKTAPRP